MTIESLFWLLVSLGGLIAIVIMIKPNKDAAWPDD